MPADPMGTAEIQRALERIDRRLDGFVTVDAWTRENDRMKERIAEGDKDCRERTDSSSKASAEAVKRLEKSTAERFDQQSNRGQVTWGRVVSVLTLVLALLGLGLAVYSASKGVK